MIQISSFRIVTTNLGCVFCPPVMQKELDKIEKNAAMVVEQNMPKDAADALLKDVKVSGTFRAATCN